MDKTTCHSCFVIESAGELRDGIGLVAAENGFFDPEEITKLLGIRPWDTKKMGTPRKNGHGVYTFSSWSGCRQDEPALDARKQCLAIVRELTPHIPALDRIREACNVTFDICIVPYIYHEQAPFLRFDGEILSFCHRTGTGLIVDPYIYG